MNTDTLHNRFLFRLAIVMAVSLSFTSSILSENSDWQLTCPDDIEVQLAPNECNTAVVFDTAAWSSTEQLVDTVFFPSSGTFFGVGTSTITLAATTVNGELEVCTFNIIVKEFEPNTLDCQFNVELSLNNECERTFTASELLELDSAGCLSNYLAARINSAGETEMPIITADDIGVPFTAVVQHQLNMSQCSAQITVTGGTPPSLACPADITIPCNTFLLPSITGMPDTAGCFEEVDFTYFDEIAVTLCSDSIAFQTTRSWVSTDPLGNIDVCQQVITAKRVDLSMAEFPDDYDGINRPVLHCSEGMSWEEITDPVFTGEPTLGGYPVDANANCDLTVNFLDVATKICGEAYQIERVWTIVNLCDASDMVRDTQYIVIVDIEAPVFTVPDTLFVSVNNLCFDSLFIPEVNIVDECSSFDVEIRSPWDTLYTNGGWSDIQLIEGNYTILYTVMDHCGNLASRITNLVVEDKTMVTCPPTDTINCDYYFGTIAPAIGFKDFEVLNQLGVPEFHSNCSLSFSETDSTSINGCGEGVLVRTLTSDSVAMDQCVQIIVVEHISNFSVQFPPDWNICTDPLEVDLGEPILSGVSCENMVTSFMDEVVPGGVGGCYSVLRTWTITNACAYNNINLNDDIVFDSLHFADGGDGIIEHVQTIVVNDRDAPTFPNGCGFPDLHVFQNDCEITITVPTPEVRGCGDIELSLSGDLGEVMGESIQLSPGEYAMSFVAVDDCGKIGTCIDTFAVLDTVAPVAFCKQGIVAEFLNTDPLFVEIWASDFDNGSFDNCNGSISHYFLEDTTLVLGTAFLDCCDLGFHPLTYVAVDASGNQSTCQTGVVLQQNLGNCDCDPLISGSITTELGQGINNVVVNIFSSAGYNANLFTDSAGNFSTVVPVGIDFSVTPQKNTNSINGVTTFDAVKMTRHILNVELLDSPYKIIAADINNSKTVTTFDIVEQRKLILNIYSNYPNNSSWRFIPADYVFPNPLNPFSAPFPELINLNNLTGDELEQDFIGIKIGDLNNSADPQE